MKLDRWLLAAALAAALAACATPPPFTPMTGHEAEPLAELEPLRTPLVEYPPVEPVEPIEPPTTEPQPLNPPPSAPAAPAQAPPTAPAAAAATVPPVPPVGAPVRAPEVSSDEHEVAALVADLARYVTLSNEDLRRELASVTQAFNHQRIDLNRVRLAMLYSLTRSPQDDQRALQLLENVARSNTGLPSVKQLAGVIQAQVVERMRAVREEQQKADVALHKLEALRVMERSLLRDRISAGGGGAAGGSGTGGGGGR